MRAHTKRKITCDCCERNSACLSTISDMIRALELLVKRGRGTSPPQPIEVTAERHLTLMRSPVVKGHTTPESGFFDFFSAVVEDTRRKPLATCSVFISVWGAPTWLHQTLMEVRAPRRRRVQ